MISKFFTPMLKSDNLKIIVLFGLGMALSYCLLLHSLLSKWHLIKFHQQQLKAEWVHLNATTETSNPLQHDPLIHYLIKLAKSHELALITTKFNNTQHFSEEFSCSTAGTYPNTIAFIKELFSSDRVFHLQELDIKSQLHSEFIHAQMVFKHDL